MKEKLIEIKNLLRGRIPALIIILVIMIGLPVTLYLVKQQQDLRSRATGSEVGSLVFSPSSPGTVNKDGTFSLEFGINFTLERRITGADITITYTDNLRLTNFEKNTTDLSEEVLTRSNTFVNPRTMRYVAVNKSGSLAPGTFVSLGRLTFKAIDNGQAEIRIADRQVVAKDQPGVLEIGDASVTFTIGGGATPPPTLPPGLVRGDVDRNGCLNPSGDPVLIWRMIQRLIPKDTSAILFDNNLDRDVDMMDYTTWWNIYITNTRNHCK